MTQKTGTAFKTISRISTLTSDIHKHTATSRIYSILETNGYPITTIRNLIKKYEKQNAKIKNNDNTTGINTVKSKKYKGLTYSTRLSEAFHNQ